MRKRAVPPLSQNSFGNLIVPLCIECTERSRIELKDLVAKMKKGIGEFREHFTQTPTGRDHAVQVVCGHSKKCEAIMGDDSIISSMFTSLSADKLWRLALLLLLAGREVDPFLGIQTQLGVPDSKVDRMRHMNSRIERRM
ncbi:Transferase [Quillaja saponaria]|uniref:Transferase n=1 Tax=Quillaja saponaria TaxID=32244 RepID=A0AAD7PJL8_QUISA|nr:Transferase [Quillaja saponaria]